MKSKIYLKLITLLFIVMSVTLIVYVNHILSYNEANLKLNSIGIYDYPSGAKLVDKQTIINMNDRYEITQEQLKSKFEDLYSQVELASLEPVDFSLSNNYYIDNIYLENLLNDALNQRIELADENDIFYEDILNNKRLNTGQKIYELDQLLNLDQEVISEPITKTPDVTIINDSITILNSNESYTLDDNEETCNSDFKPKNGRCPSNQGYYQKDIDYSTTCVMIGGDWNNEFEACFTIEEEYYTPTCGLYTQEQAKDLIPTSLTRNLLDQETYRDKPIECNIYRFTFDDGTIIDIDDSGVIYSEI